MPAIQLDRRRIYIVIIGLVILFLLLGFYHSPNYVPAEISKVKTSVSTWLKGSEPSLGDETYKDHFDAPEAQSTTDEHTEGNAPSSHPAESEKTSDDQFYALPISGDDRPDILPPAITSTTSSLASHASAVLPAAHDFVNVLPPVNVLATSSFSELASSSATASSSTDEPPIWAHVPIPEATESADYHTASGTAHVASHSTDVQPIWADSIPQATTLATHISSTAVAASSVAATSSVEEKWYLDEKAIPS